MGTASTARYVLIVEDEWIIAETLQDIVLEAGFRVRGPAGRVDDALEIVQNDSLDLALLDVSLHGQKSFPVARALADKSIPFLFVTGYVGTDLPEDLRSRPVLNKPVNAGNLIASIRQVIGLPEHPR